MEWRLRRREANRSRRMDRAAPANPPTPVMATSNFAFEGGGSAVTWLGRVTKTPIGVWTGAPARVWMERTTPGAAPSTALTVPRAARESGPKALTMIDLVP